MTGLPRAFDIVQISQRIATARTLSEACRRMVDELASALGVPCAALARTVADWRVEASVPVTLELPVTLGSGTSVLPLGEINGTLREVVIRHDQATAPDARWLAAAGTILGHALSVVAMRADLERRRTLERRCLRFSRELLLLKDTSRLRQLIVERMARAVDAETAALALYIQAERSLAVVATRGYPSALVDHIRIRPGEGVIGSVFASRRSVTAEAPSERANGGRQSRYRSRSYMAVPLVGAEGALGVVAVTDAKIAEPFTREHLYVLRAYALAAALALSCESLRDQTAQLAHLATVDPLTGLFNRRFFDERLLQEIQRGRREGADLALLMIDIDDFKALNDARGHLYGDRVLREIAEILRRSVRIFDVCSRFGGEEFAILMPGANASTALHVAERIRQAESDFVNNWRFASGLPTLSIGVATAGTEKSGEALIAAADAALLWAKTTGKNTVKLETDLPTRPPAR